MLALFGFAVRAPALQGQLVWDDQYLARDNPFIKSPLLILETFRHHLFLDSFSAHYRPVQNISFIFDYMLWNTNTYGFHLTNVLLHVLSGILLYFLLRKLFLVTDTALINQGRVRSASAFVIALLWIVHPVHSAAVDYISGRADSLAFVFACGGWLLVFRAREITSRFARLACYGLAATCGLLSLCSREIACIWFALFLLHIFFFEKQLGRRAKIVSLGCCVVLLGIYGGLRQLPERRANANPSSEWSRPTRAVLMLRALGDYGRLMILSGEPAHGTNGRRSEQLWDEGKLAAFRGLRISFHSRTRSSNGNVRWLLAKGYRPVHANLRCVLVSIRLRAHL